MKTTTNSKARAAEMVAASLAQAEKDIKVWRRNGIPTAQKETEIEAMRAALAAMG